MLTVTYCSITTFLQHNVTLSSALDSTLKLAYLRAPFE